MKWQDIGEQPCSIARTLSVVGDRWTMLILRNAFMGVRRFDAFQSILGVTRHVLSNRLKLLTENDILTKVPYQDRQERFEYRLTEKGIDLYPLLMSLIKWGDKWMDQGFGAPLEYVHKSCGNKFTPLIVCSECGESITPKTVTPMMGPGMAHWAARMASGEVKA